MAPSCVLQAVEIVREPEQQGLTTLREQAAAGSAAGELAFGSGEDGLDQRTPTIEATGEVASHLGANAVDAPSFLAAFPTSDPARGPRAAWV
ncbi:MAG TPA: hypothetical protein VF311_03310 [Terriglobales bacterium]